MTDLTEAVRRRCWHSVSYDSAQAAGLSLQQMRMFVSRTITLTPEQIVALARYLRIEPPRCGNTNGLEV
jgi:hypothetical protein